MPVLEDGKISITWKGFRGWLGYTIATLFFGALVLVPIAIVAGLIRQATMLAGITDMKWWNHNSSYSYQTGVWAVLIWHASRGCGR